MYPSPNTASESPIAGKSRRCPGPAIRWPRNGPINAPTPRAAIRMPKPMLPESNTSRAITGIRASKPAAAPNPNFTASRDRTRWSRRAKRHVSWVASTIPGCSVVSALRLGEAPPDRGEQRRRHQEGAGVHEEGRVGPEHGADQAAEPGADGEHRSPERAVQRVRGREILRVDDVRRGRGEGGVERCREGRQHGQQDVREPDRLGADEEERDADHRPGEIADDHQLAAVDPVRERSADRRREEEGGLLGEDREAHVERLPRWTRRSSR